MSIKYFNMLFNKIFFLLFSLFLLFIDNPCHSQSSWEQVDLPSDVQDVYSIATDTNNLLLIGTDQGVLREIPGTEDWETILSLSRVGVIMVDDDNNIYASTSDLYVSQDEGDTWTKIYTHTIEYGITTIYKDQGGSVFFGMWGGIYKQDSITSNFNLVLNLGYTEVVERIVKDTETDVLYAGTVDYTDTGGIYTSTDGGNNWTLSELQNHFVSDLEFNSNNDLYASTRGHSYYGTGGVFKKLNGTDEWINVNNQEIVTSMEINEEDEIYIGCSDIDFYSAGIRFSLDSGDTWNTMNEGLDASAIDELIIDKEGYLITFTIWNIVYKTTSTTVPVPLIPSLTDVSVKVYPNPFNQQLRIKTNNCPTGNYFLKVINSIGQILLNEPISISNPTDDITIYTPQLQSGVYFLNLSNSSLNITKSIVK